MQVKLFFWAVAYSLPLLLVTLYSAEDDDVPVMCLAEAVSILQAKFIQLINCNHNYQYYKSIWEQLVHQLTSFVYLVQPLLKLSMKGEMCYDVLSAAAEISKYFFFFLHRAVGSALDLYWSQSRNPGTGREKSTDTRKIEGKTRRAVRLTCCIRSYSVWWKPLGENGSTVNSNESVLDFDLLGLEVLHEQKFYQLSGQPIPVLEYPYNKVFFLKSIISANFCCFYGPGWSGALPPPAAFWWVLGECCLPLGQGHYFATEFWCIPGHITSLCWHFLPLMMSQWWHFIQYSGFHAVCLKGFQSRKCLL